MPIVPPTPEAAPTPPVQQEQDNDDFAVLIVERDPGLRGQIWDYPPNVQEKARLAYMKHGPYQFHKDEKPVGRRGSDKFIVEGFKKWKKVNNGKDCAFLTHMGKDSKSAHNYAVKCYDNLKNKQCHLEQLVEKQTEEDIKRNRLRLKVTIDVL
uniref:Uncharacterized protein n=1 Tax=Avena sativa TaxID=4498 RepID=A0ACD5YGH6_AVESA